MPKEYTAIKVSMNNGVNGVAAAITKPTTTQFTVPSLTYKHPSVIPNKLSLYLRPVKKVSLYLRVYNGCTVEINGLTFSSSSSYQDFETFIDNEALDSNDLKFVVTRNSNTFNFVDPKVLYGKNALGHSTNYQNVTINRSPEKLDTQTQCAISIKNINVMQTYVSIDIQLKKTLTMNLNMSWVETISQNDYLAVTPGLGKGMYLSIMKASNQSGWDGIAVVKSDTASNAETFESKAVRAFDNNSKQFKYTFEVTARQIAFYLRTMPKGTSTQDTEYVPSNVIKKVEFDNPRDYSAASGYPTEMTIANESFTILNLGWFKIEPDMTKDEINVNLKVTKYPTHTVVIDITKIKQTWAAVQKKFGMTLDLIGSDNSKHRQEPETDTDNKQIYKFQVPDVWPSSSYPRRFKFQLTSPSGMSSESEIVKYSMTAKWGTEQIISYSEENAGFIFDSNNFPQVRTKLNTATSTSKELTYSITPIEGEPRMKVVYIDVWTGVPNGGNQHNGWDRYTNIPEDFIICPTGEYNSGIINVYLNCQYYSADNASIKIESNLLYYTESNSPIKAECGENPWGSDASHLVTISHRSSDFYTYNESHSTGKVWSGQSCNLDIKYLTGAGEQRGFIVLNFHIGTIGKIHLSPSDTSHAKPEVGGYFVINCMTTTYEKSGDSVTETPHYYSESPTVFYSPICDKPSVLNYLNGPTASGGPDKLKYEFMADPGVQSAVITFKVGLQDCPWYKDVTLPVSISNFMTLVHEKYNHGNGFVETTHQISTVIWSGTHVAEFCFYCPNIATDGGDLFISGRLIDLGLVTATKQRVTESGYNYIIRLSNTNNYYYYNSSATTANRVAYNEANPFTVEYKIGSESKQSMQINTVCGPVLKITLSNQSGSTIGRTIGSQWKFNAYLEVWNTTSGTTKYKPGEFSDFSLLQECTWSDGSSTNFNTYFTTETTTSSDIYTTSTKIEISNPMTISTRIVSSSYSEFNTNPLKTTVTGFQKYINIWSNDPNDRTKDVMLCAAPSGRRGGFYTYNSTTIPDGVKFRLDDYDSYRGVYYATFKVVEDNFGLVRLYRIRQNSTTETLTKFVYGWNYLITRPESWNPYSYVVTAGEHNVEYAGMEHTCFTSGYSEYGTYNKLTAYFTTHTSLQVMDETLKNLETHSACHFYLNGAHGGTYYYFKDKPMSFTNPLPTQVPKCRYYVNWGLTSNVYSDYLDDYPMWEFPID